MNRESKKFWNSFRKLSSDDKDKALLDHMVTGAMYVRTKADGTVERVAPDAVIVAEDRTKDS